MCPDTFRYNSGYSNHIFIFKILNSTWDSILRICVLSGKSFAKAGGMGTCVKGCGKAGFCKAFMQRCGKAAEEPTLLKLYTGFTQSIAKIDKLRKSSFSAGANTVGFCVRLGKSCVSAELQKSCIFAELRNSCGKTASLTFLIQKREKG